jgi:peptide/nickel transport system permease protein
VLRRLLLMVPTFLGITLLTFVVAQWAPGDPFQLDLETAGPSQAVIDAQRAAKGLDAPLPLQFGRWLSRVVRFDFGRSFVDQRPVMEKLSDFLPKGHNTNPAIFIH